MSIKTLLEKLTDKWLVKVICVIAACFFYLFNQYNSLEQKSLPVSLDVIQNGEMLCTTHIPSSVSVTIKTGAENISQVNASGIVANLDMSYYTREGNFDVPVYVDLPSNLRSLEPLQVTVIPEKVTVHLEKNTAKTVKVVPRAVGQIPYGYNIKNFVCDPPYISIYGPRSIVESITSLQTEAVIVDEQKATFSETKKIVNLDKLVKVEGEGEVNITTEIDFVQGAKTFSRYPIVIKNLDERFVVEERFTANFSVSGSQLFLDEYEPIPDVLSVDLSEVTEIGEYEFETDVTIPYQLNLETLSAETVKLTVKERPAPVAEEAEGAAE